ncbi:MAG: TlpA family protein disulfide reductase [Gammaproteobacteria bacterium]
MQSKFILAAIIIAFNLLSPSVFASEVGEVAPQFNLPTLQNNQPIGLDQYKGKVVYLDFWASWCAPCRTSFPLLNKLYEKLKNQGFEVVAVNLDEDKEKAEAFLKEIPVDFTILRDETGELSDRYVVESMPTSFIIDRQGVIQNIHKGFVSEDIEELEKKIAALLANK